jgi:hypothetical protein
MTEQEAKYARKLKQAIRDSTNVIPERYTLDNLEADLKQLRSLDNLPGERKLSTKMIAGLLRWQVDNL